ncbi:helix-turn-helix domain-containing protein [Hydrocarboniphaga effusa]|uniref:helix-turn-helix domain-containing protein n=1 Tax=Hydrocarboniphaga effusa TaxID=243629 RepID=UPI00398BEA9F
MELKAAEKLGSVLRARRVALGVSQEAFADQIEMHRTYYSAIERGEKNLQIDTLQRVCAGLQVSLWVIFKEAGL